MLIFFCMVVSLGNVLEYSCVKGGISKVELAGRSAWLKRREVLGGGDCSRRYRVINHHPRIG